MIDETLCVERLTGAANVTGTSSHQATIADQFSRQAAQFAAAPALHNQAALDLLVEAAEPSPGDTSLDVACGPGTVVIAFAGHVRQAAGLDATEAMLVQARKLAERSATQNVSLHLGDVYALPFDDGTFDIVSCRFALHHFETPAGAFAEMVRVCRPGGRIVLCDAIASDDARKAEAFNRMERHRDPSTVEFRSPGFLSGLFTAVALPTPRLRFYQVPIERDALISLSFPAADDRELLRAMIDQSVIGDTMGLNARRDGDTVKFAYPSVILVATKP
jgi:ubiquinone/menaquinone biosynthesis C-methylase UbiE